MELSLYCPEIGYYERNEQAVGRAGDFVTSVSAGDLFGRMIGQQFAAWCAEISGPITWVEAGAHNGRLALDLLTATSVAAPKLFERLEYLLVEPSPRRRNWQQEMLRPFAGKVRWVSSLEELPRGVRGIIFANELLDAFPVHRLRWNAHQRTWQEWGVCAADTQFQWCVIHGSNRPWTAELSSAGIDIPTELANVLPDGFTLEVAPTAAQWWSAAAAALSQGRLLTFDYGLLAHELLAPERATGTLRAYHQHSVSDQLLDTPGAQDLTAHVNFSQLIRAGERAGMKTDGLYSQAEFLSPIAAKLWDEDHPPTTAEARRFRTLAHPEHLGRAFRVLVQSRA